MEAFAQIDMLEIGLIMCEFLGETKRVISKKIILFRIFNYHILVLVLGYIFLNFFYSQGEYFVKTLQSLFLVLHVLLKYTLLTTQTSSIQYVFNNILTKFWNYRYFDESVRTTTKQIHKTVKYFEVIIFFTSMSAVFFFLLRTLIVSKPILPLDCFIPESYIMLAILALCQFYCVWPSMISVLAYDFIYVACCIHVILQVRLLKQKIRHALDKSKENPKQRICYYIEHHQFLYSMFHHMRNIFSVMLLFHYLVTLILVCFVLLQFFARSMDPVNYVLELIIIAFLIAQFALYTFPAEAIAFEFLDISNTIYTSKWYKHDVETQKLILYVMMKSQQQKYFTGAGLVDINVQTFDTVFRKALSFCAIFNNLLKN